MRIAFAVALSLVVVVGASADPDPVTHCCTGKLRQSGTRLRQLFGCHAKAAAHGTTVDPECLAHVRQALERQFARVEVGGGCLAAGDADRVDSDLERTAATTAALLRPTLTASACASGKLKAAGRLAQAVARAFGDEAPRPADRIGELNPVLQSLSAHLAAAFARQEVRPGCLTMNDSHAVATAAAFGVSTPSSPDGILRVSLRVCLPVCGDNTRGGGEQCDGLDASDCNGACKSDCTCPAAATIP